MSDFVGEINDIGMDEVEEELDEKNVSFDSNEKDFLETISWDTESGEEDLQVDDGNFKLF